MEQPSTSSNGVIVTSSAQSAIIANGNNNGTVIGNNNDLNGVMPSVMIRSTSSPQPRTSTAPNGQNTTSNANGSRTPNAKRTNGNGVSATTSPNHTITSVAEAERELAEHESELGLHSSRRQEAAAAHAAQQRSISGPLAAHERYDEKRGTPDIHSRINGYGLAPSDDNDDGHHHHRNGNGTPSAIIVDKNDRTNDMKKPLLPVSQVNLVDHYQKFNTPTIRLEEASPRAVKMMMAVTYITLLAAMISGFFEQSSHTIVKEFRFPQPTTEYVPICELSSTHNTSELTCHLSANFKPIELYFSLQLFVDRQATPQAIAAAAMQNDIIDGITYSGNDHHRTDTRSIWQRWRSYLGWTTPHVTPYLPKIQEDFNVTIAMRGANSNGVRGPIIYADTASRHLDCQENVTLCHNILLVEPADYEFSYEEAEHSFVQWNVSVTLHYGNVSLTDFGGLAFVFQHPDAYMRYVSIGIHVVLLVFTFFYQVFWFRKLRARGWKRLLPEQKWISILLVTLVLYQDPFFIPLLLNRFFIFRDLSGAGYIMSASFMLTFWLLMLDGIKATGDNMKKQNIGGDGSKLYRYSWRFYIPKILLGSILCISYLLYFIFSQTPLLRRQTMGSDHDDIWVYKVFNANGSSINALIFTCVLIAEIGAVIWLVWMIRITCSASSDLKKLPYLSTRFRQLSFRFFVLQAWLMITYFFFFILVGAFKGQPTGLYAGEQGITTGYMSILVLISVYIYLTTWTYIPAGEHKPKTMARSAHASGHLDTPEQQEVLGWLVGAVSQFVGLDDKGRLLGRRLDTLSIHTARFLTDLTWQTYYMPPIPDPVLFPEEDEPKRAEGFIDLRAKSNMKLLYFCERPLTDTYSYICEQTSGPLEGVIIIAFRGTVTIKNAKTDISVSRVPFHLPGMSDAVGKVHNGFYHAFSQVRDDIMNQVALLLETKRNTSRIPGGVPVICVGHSLGGALATICALELAHRFKSQISLQTYTFGCPRVGDRRFANEYDRRVPFTFRFVFDRDFVTSVPKFYGLYKHVGLEILIDAAGNYILDPSWVEKVMLDSRRSLADHQLVSYQLGLDQVLIELDKA